MKVLAVLLVVSSFGFVGLAYKKRLKTNVDALNYVLSFENYYNSNMTLFKMDIHEIINNFIIMQKNKNAYFCNIFEKSSNIYKFNDQFLKNILIHKDDTEIILKYFSELGKNEYDFEKEKNKNFEQYLQVSIKKSEKLLNEKGSLYFKLLLAIGAVIGIVIW